MTSMQKTAAERLLGAYPPGRLVPVPDDLALADESEAYAIQARVAASLGMPCGWKLGGIVRGETPRYSRLFSELCRPSPARFSHEDFHRVYLEPELAVVLGEPIPAREAPYGQEEVAACVASLHAAIELVDSRFEAWPEVPPLWQLADGLSHGAFVLGSGTSSDGLGSMRDAAYRLCLDDEEVLAGAGGHPGGDPAELLVTMINARIRASGEGFAAGDVITTGTFAGVIPMLPGQRASLRFLEIGEVVLDLS
ncbi:MAG: fumarylacetoacetate hydrolase family protein [Halomonas sp.]|uniref:2-keto-4-pentenoate hydratase n=1 Tax=Billgrantia antri TaxID=2846777 RepID=UPI0029C4569F|nr:fumarylacetoacetate hydrolase family protein [Halomonas sp.]MDX5503121.1 fumarylacetoacetate hydrolase family protein [Halomonas sp.]